MQISIPPRVFLVHMAAQNGQLRIESERLHTDGHIPANTVYAGLRPVGRPRTISWSELSDISFLRYASPHDSSFVEMIKLDASPTLIYDNLLPRNSRSFGRRALD